MILVAAVKDLMDLALSVLTICLPDSLSDAAAVLYVEQDKLP